MLNKLINISERTYILLLVLAVAVYELCFIGQGFSLLDEGMVMASSQWIFTDPECVQYQMLFYNETLIGGIWNHFFGSWGYLGFRLCNLLCIECICISVYITLRGIVVRWSIFCGLLLALLVYDGGCTVIHHNYISALLAILSVNFVLRALTDKSCLMMFVAGVLVAVNVFTRIPNISLCALFLVIVPYYLCNKSDGMTSRFLFSAVGGLVVGVAVELAIMAALGHLSLFIDSLSSGFSATTASDSTHNLHAMIVLYAKQFGHILLFSVFFILFFFCQLYDVLSRGIRMVISLLALFCVVYFYNTSYFVYAFTTIPLLLTILQTNNTSNAEELYLFLLLLLPQYLLPLGSDFGVVNMGYASLFLSLPYAVEFFYVLSNMKKDSALYCFMVCIFFAVFVCHAVFDNVKQAEFDNGFRWEKIYRINHPLANTYTNKRYADAMNELLPVLGRYVRKGDYMLDYVGYPTLYYLLGCKPYICNTWTRAYDSDNLEYQIHKAEKSSKPLPVVLLGKGEGVGDFTVYDPDWNNTKVEDTFSHKNGSIKAVHSFIKRHDYKVSWENDIFQILVPRR